MTTAPAARLSGLQRAILLYLAQERIAGRTMAQWQPSRWYPTWSPSNRAVFSRALHRLEARGLILRQNQRAAVPGSWTGYRRSVTDPFMKRTTTIELTPIGREVAERLTNGVSPDVSRSGRAAA